MKRIGFLLIPLALIFTVVMAFHSPVFAQEQHNLNYLEQITTFQNEQIIAQIDDIEQPNNDFILENRDIVIEDTAGRVRYRVDSPSGSTRMLDQAGNPRVFVDADGTNIWLGSDGDDGDIVLLPRTATEQNLNQASIHLDGGSGTESLGGSGTDGNLVLRNQSGDQTLLLRGRDADFILGQNNQAGDIFIRNGDGLTTINADGATGNLQLGRDGQSGSVEVKNGAGQTTLNLNGGEFTSTSGGGSIIIRNQDEQSAIRLFGNASLVEIGSDAQDGRLIVEDGVIIDGESAQIYLGNGNTSGDLFVLGQDGGIVIELNGNGRVNAAAVSVGDDGIEFGDGTVQTTAQLVGPQGPAGPQGPQGPAGPPVSTSAVCQSGTEQSAAPVCGLICTGSTFAQVSSPCAVTADTGSCSALSFEPGPTTPGSVNRGSCCVCAS